MAKDIELLPITRQVRDYYCHARQGTTQRWGDHSFDAEFDAWLADHEAEIAAGAVQSFAETLGVNVGDDDDEWWEGYRQGQRRALHMAVEWAAERRSEAV